MERKRYIEQVKEKDERSLDNIEKIILALENIDLSCGYCRNSVFAGGFRNRESFMKFLQTSLC
ncbi:MAG: hypothetical protein PHN69_05510, partial [Candidatus Pacebacteria bacterium]|nr:hypothetical protein [Candidatus Paceibacterota bacterium]